MKVIYLFRNRNFILILALLLGFAIGKDGARWTQSLILPALALVMTLSATSITSRELISLKTMPGRVVLALVLNYVVMGGIILLMAWWLVDDPDLRAGLVVIAMVPPAVAVAPFTFILGGDILLSLVSMTVAYFAALLITPAAIVLFLGTTSFNPGDLLIIIGELILIPLVVSRILIASKVMNRIGRWRGTIVNWSFFLVLFTAIGLNRDALFSQPEILLSLTIIAVTVSFILGYVIKFITGAMRVKQEASISFVLMGTMKNYGLASGILLTLFNEKAAIPASVCIIFGLLQMIWLGFLFKKP